MVMSKPLQYQSRLLPNRKFSFGMVFCARKSGLFVKFWLPQGILAALNDFFPLSFFTKLLHF